MVNTAEKLSLYIQFSINYVDLWSTFSIFSPCSTWQFRIVNLYDENQRAKLKCHFLSRDDQDCYIRKNKIHFQLHVLMEVADQLAAQAPTNVGKGKEIVTVMLTVPAF